MRQYGWNFRKPDGTPDPAVRAFPIHTLADARAALRMADLPGNADVRERVYAAVHRRYPELKHLQPQNRRTPSGNPRPQGS